MSLGAAVTSSVALRLGGGRGPGSQRARTVTTAGRVTRGLVLLHSGFVPLGRCRGPLEPRSVGPGGERGGAGLVPGRSDGRRREVALGGEGGRWGPIAGSRPAGRSRPPLLTGTQVSHRRGPRWRQNVRSGSAPRAARPVPSPLPFPWWPRGASRWWTGALRPGQPGPPVSAPGWAGAAPGS